uniref:Phytocyanin domain-containing protein n=1 Tax=Kalanchoe fedtschenkoi TaxID=63787 RepID=A0A7N0T0E0_KALFE
MIPISILLGAAAALLVAVAPVGGSICTQDFDYAAWAASQTFHVGDTLVFENGAGSSADQVSASADGAPTCIDRNPINPGLKTLTLSAAGPWHLICPNGQALEITVIATTTTTPSPPGSTADHRAPQPWYYPPRKAVTSILYYLAWTPWTVVSLTFYYLAWTPVKVIGWTLYYLALAAWNVILSIFYYLLWTPGKVLCWGFYYLSWAGWSVVLWILYYVAWTPSKAVGWGLHYVVWGVWKLVFWTSCFFAFVLLEGLMKPVNDQCFEAVRGWWFELLRLLFLEKLTVIRGQWFEPSRRFILEKLN